MNKLATGIKGTIYPFEYNKNNPMHGFNDWALHIKSQLQEIPSIDMVLIEAKKIINNPKELQS